MGSSHYISCAILFIFIRAEPDGYDMIRYECFRWKSYTKISLRLKVLLIAFLMDMISEQCILPTYRKLIEIIFNNLYSALLYIGRLHFKSQLKLSL